MCDSSINSLDNICSCPNHSKVKKKRDVPNLQHELNVAKAILQETSTVSGDNMFDHLSDIIKRILDERPPNLIDYFEEYSRNIREKKFRIQNEFLKEAFEETRNYKRALAIMNSFKLLEYANTNNEMEEEMLSPNMMPIYRPISLHENIIKLQHVWYLCGLGLHTDETFMLSCALQKLQQHPGLQYARFWGKIFGIHKNYYIAEANLNQSEIEKRMSLMKDEVLERMKPIVPDSENIKYLNTLINSKTMVPGSHFQHLSESEIQDFIKESQKPIPKPEIPIQFDIPPEPIGVGLNRSAYFVINSLTDDWIELPSVTPRQIFESKNIPKYLKGDLEADIISYPYFHGKEKHYLRTLIARITASTFIAPNNYYMKAGRTKLPSNNNDEEEEDGEEEEEEEEESDKDKNVGISKWKEAELIINPNYKSMSIEDLEDIRMWVHIRASISKQGRVTYFDEVKALQLLNAKNKLLNDKQNDEEDDEDEQDDEEEEEDSDDSHVHRLLHKKASIKIQVPSILVSCATDKTSELIPPWTVRLSNTFNKTNVAVIMKSNLWPGAYSVAYENLSDNIYVGWGNKYFTRNYSPEHIPPIQNEYPITADLIEITDPSVTMEEEWRIAHMPKISLEEGSEEDEEDEEDEEEEEEEEEDDTNR